MTILQTNKHTKYKFGIYVVLLFVSTMIVIGILSHIETRNAQIEYNKAIEDTVKSINEIKATKTITNPDIIAICSTDKYTIDYVSVEEYSHTRVVKVVCVQK